jgi:peptidoglycan/LPS O-acetylase OafA/YrhL
VAPGTGRFDYLDGIRAIAIGAVLSLHWLSWYSPLFHGGSIGVDVFLVLSGFIITTMLWRSPASSSLWATWGAFLKRRVVRLYPALLGLVTVAVVLYAATPEAPVAPADVAGRGLLALGQVSAVWLAVSGNGIWTPAINPFGQTWSLAIEWYFYLLWPLLVLRARSRAVDPRTWAIVSLASAVVLYAFALPLSDAWFYFGPVSRFAEILAGAAVALWFQAGGVPSRPLRSATPAAAACLVVIGSYTLLGPHASSSLYRYLGVPVTVLATVMLMYVGYSNQDGPVHRFLSHPWVTAVGRSSYSLYLWHMIPVLLMQEASHAWSMAARGLVAVAATAALTAASYRFLERPFLRPRSDVLDRSGALGSEHAPVHQRGDEVVG